MPSRVASKSSAIPAPDVVSPALLMPALLLFVSGAAALVYQVLWIKQLSLVVGVEVYAITTGISAFFAGLALGGLLFGRWADRMQQPVLLYAGLEVLVAVLGVGATFAMSLAASPFAWLEQQIGPLVWVLPFALVGIPALLMGGTLPVLVRSLTSDPQHLGKAGGQLYAANTARAVAGPLLAAAGALWFQRQRQAPVEIPFKHHAEQTTDRLALWLYSIAGGVALGYEVNGWRPMAVVRTLRRCWRKASRTIPTLPCCNTPRVCHWCGLANRIRPCLSCAKPHNWSHKAPSSVTCWRWRCMTVERSIRPARNWKDCSKCNRPTAMRGCR